LIHVVVVAYKNASTIIPCVRPLLSDAGVTRVVVVDNSSDQDIEALCSAEKAGCRLIYIPEDNIGYARACNLGVTLMTGDDRYVAILNPDVTLVRPLSQLAGLAESDHGSLFSALLSQARAGLNARPMASLGGELLNALIGSRAYSRLKLRSHEGFETVPQIDGSLLLIPAAEYRALGGFDERYELYYEDVDLCRRANVRDGCRLFPKVWGAHVGGASYGQGCERPYLALRASRARYLLKWYGPLVAPIVIIVATLEAIIRTVGTSTPSKATVLRGAWVQLMEVVQPNRRGYLLHDR